MQVSRAADIRRAQLSPAGYQRVVLARAFLCEQIIYSGRADKDAGYFGGSHTVSAISVSWLPGSSSWSYNIPAPADVIQDYTSWEKA